MKRASFSTFPKNTQKLKGAAVNAITAIADSVSSLFGSGKVKKLEEEKEQLKKNISERNGRVAIVQKEKKEIGGAAI